MLTRLRVSGMSCGNCVRHVEGALRELPGVESVQVDLSAGTALVQHDAAASLAGMLAAVSEEGYEAQPL